MMGFQSAWFSLLISFTLLQCIKSQSVTDFSNYPANSRPCLVSAATSSNCPTANVPEFNGCVCSNGGNFVTSAVQCLTASDSGDLTSVYGTMSSNCATSNTPLGYTLQQFLALGGTGTTAVNNPPSTTTVTGVTTISQQGTTKVSTFVTTAMPKLTTSSQVTTIVITPTGTGQTAPFTSVITLVAGGSQTTGTSAAQGNGGSNGGSGGSKLSTTAIIGIGVGGALCLAIVGLIVTLCWCQRRREKRNRAQQFGETAAAVPVAQSGLVTSSQLSRPESSVATFTNASSAPYDANLAQQNRFSNMSYTKPSSPGHQSPNPRYSQQALGAQPYMVPQQTPTPPGQPNWQPTPPPGGMYGAAPPYQVAPGGAAPMELPGHVYTPPQELPGGQQPHYGYN